MSRHRFVKNINIQDELEDEALSDGGDDPMSLEDQEQLDETVALVRSILGSEETSGVSDTRIREAAWEFYFDVQQTTSWLLEDQSKRAARERKAVKKKTPPSSMLSPSQTPCATTSRAASSAASIMKSTKMQKQSNIITSTLHDNTDQQQIDLAGLNLQDTVDVPRQEEFSRVPMARESVLEAARVMLDADSQGRQCLNLVIIGHVDAGKSTLMGRLLYELGRMDDKRRIANERASEKAGKGSFSWAWELDGTVEERNRGVTIDIGVQTFSTLKRNITVLDAPGHRDFVPNMISGASQADCALLVVDSSSGEFEAGFEKGGQTKEHLLLVRSLGVSQVIVALNKMDQVNWDSQRYQQILGSLRPYMSQTGFSTTKTKFVPVSALSGNNLVRRIKSDMPDVWYGGPTLVDLLDELEVPPRSLADLEAPLRFPISNVFKGQTSLSSGLGVSGRVCSGIIQVGERVRVLPGDESATVRLIESAEEESVPWAAAGVNVTLYLSGIELVHLSKGNVLCPPSDLVPLATRFVAQIIVFDIDLPITLGTSVELFHHSQNVPATISKLFARMDRGTLAVLKTNPRILPKLSAGRVEISLRQAGMSGVISHPLPIPLELFQTNKEMGRILLRRGGETIAAGVVMELL